MGFQSHRVDAFLGAFPVRQLAEAFKHLAGLVAISLVGSFLQGLAQGLGAGGNDGAPVQRPQSDDPAGFALVFGRSNPNGSWFVAVAAGTTNG